MIEPILHVCIVGIKICYCADVRIATVDDCRLDKFTASTGTAVTSDGSGNLNMLHS